MNSKQVHVEYSERLNASPEQIYGILQDYTESHPAILPRQYFQELVVEKGGRGAGTVVHTRLKVMGVEQTFTLEVSEPEPGRVLTETDKATGVVTIFTVEPVGEQNQCELTIASDFKASPGLKGFMEKLVQPGIVRKIYKAEFRLIAQYARDQTLRTSAKV